MKRRTSKNLTCVTVSIRASINAGLTNRFRYDLANVWPSSKNHTGYSDNDSEAKIAILPTTQILHGTPISGSLVLPKGKSIWSVRFKSRIVITTPTVSSMQKQHFLKRNRSFLVCTAWARVHCHRGALVRG